MILGTITMPETNRIYHDMDLNRSGTITFDEFVAGLEKYRWDTSNFSFSKKTSTANQYEWEIPFSEIKIEKKLGEGSFGTVFKAKWRGCDVACKELKDAGKVTSDVLEDFKKEIAILGKLRHPNVVLYMGASTKPPHLCMVTEYLDGGSLYEKIHQKKEKLDLKSLLYVGKQTAFGLNYLHLSDIIHRDLKSMNLLADRYLTVKLCDFGLSCIKPKDTSLIEQVGSPLVSTKLQDGNLHYLVDESGIIARSNI
jgi:serine/threonine protein kinase